MAKFLKIFGLALFAMFIANEASAQHTLGMTGGYGMTTFRPYPAQETRAIWGNATAGLSWRYYGPQRFAGGFGVDLEYLERGFSYAPYTSLFETEEDWRWYTRRVKSIMMPIIWQPHVYVAKNRVRIYLDLAAFFSYNLSGRYDNQFAAYQAEQGDDTYVDKPTSGEYVFKEGRDNRWGYGLAGGGGLSVLTGRVEWNFRVRYYFGYSDLMRNRNRYPDNLTDEFSDAPAANPFRQTPLRSPIDNLMFSVGVSFRMGKGSKDGFREWQTKPLRSRKMEDSFDYKM